MPRGPLGFPRLTNVGPLVKRDREFKPESEVDFNERDYNFIERGSIRGDCSPFSYISLPIEFIIPIDYAEPVGVVDYPATHIELYEEIKKIDKGDKFIGVHETPEENVQDIIENGFSKETSGRHTVKNDIDFRRNAVYTWQYRWDIDGLESNSALLVSAPTEKVIASDMSASVTAPSDVYVSNYTMPYINYIRCLRKYGPATPIEKEKDLLQDTKRLVK